MKIKSRKQRELDYLNKYGDVSYDAYTRLQNELGDLFNEETLSQAIDRAREINENIKFSKIKMIFYEVPVQTMRPRSSAKIKGMYVPNAMANYQAVDKFLSQLDEVIQIIAMPVKVKLKAYLPMPAGTNPVDMVLFETEHVHGIGKPDADNICKAYLDMLQKHLILDDDLVVSVSTEKYFSLKPRVELSIIYPNGILSDKIYKMITSRKTYKSLNEDQVLETKLIVKPYKKKKHKK